MCSWTIRLWMFDTYTSDVSCMKLKEFEGDWTIFIRNKMSFQRHTYQWRHDKLLISLPPDATTSCLFSRLTSSLIALQHFTFSITTMFDGSQTHFNNCDFAMKLHVYINSLKMVVQMVSVEVGGSTVPLERSLRSKWYGVQVMPDGASFDLAECSTKEICDVTLLAAISRYIFNKMWCIHFLECAFAFIVLVDFLEMVIYVKWGTRSIIVWFVRVTKWWGSGQIYELWNERGSSLVEARALFSPPFWGYGTRTTGDEF